MNIVGIIKFDDRNMCVYRDANAPMFKVTDIIRMLNYDIDLVEVLNMCESDERMQDEVDGELVHFVDERGLYSILAQHRSPIARKWRRVVFNQLIELRKSKDMTIEEQFEDWDHALDGVYYDEETGLLMESVTVEGGDVMQVPFKKTP